MLYFRCYYKLDGKVLFLSHAVNRGGEILFAVYDCAKRPPREDEAPYCAHYSLSREPRLLSYDDLIKAENLNEKCLSCVYCKMLADHYPIDKKEKLFEACGGLKTVVLECEYNFTPFSTRLFAMMPECQYIMPPPLRIKTVEDQSIGDIREFFRAMDTKYGRHVYSSEIEEMPPKVFMRIHELLDKDDLVYFGSGLAGDDDRGWSCFEQLTQYLDWPGSDFRTFCVRASDITEDVYTELIGELDDETLGFSGDFDNAVVCIPALDFATFSGEQITGYKWGYVVCAPQRIIELIEEAEKTLIG